MKKPRSRRGHSSIFLVYYQSHQGLASDVQSPKWMYCFTLRRSYRCFRVLSGRSAAARNGFLFVRSASLITSNDFVIFLSFLKSDKARTMPNDGGDYAR